MQPRLIAKLVTTHKSDEDCAICYRHPYKTLDDLDKEDEYTVVFKSHCKHSFCFECLRKYDDSRKRFTDELCPCCRDDISPMIIWLIYDEMRYIRWLLDILAHPLEETPPKRLRLVAEWFFIPNSKRANKKTLYNHLAKLVL